MEPEIAMANDNLPNQSCNPYTENVGDGGMALYLKITIVMGLCK